MSCGNCKHWRTSKDVNNRNEGVCVKFTAEYKAPEGKNHVEETKRTKRRRGHTPRESGAVYVTWGFDPGPLDEPYKPVTSLNVYLKTKPGFSCSLFEALKRKRRLPVVTEEARPSRFERVVAEEEG